MTERLHFYFSLSCIGEGSGNPFQRSCLENPRDGGAWWAAVSGVTQSRTRLSNLAEGASASVTHSFNKYLLNVTMVLLLRYVLLLLLLSRFSRV